MAAICQFVDSISATPTLRLDLNLAPWRTLADTDFGFPEMRRAVASTLMTDGEQISASAYGNRVLRLSLMVDTASVDSTATELQKLVRELNRSTNILRTQLGTEPIFFRTFRASPEAWQIITTGTRITIDAAVPAEPFALGLQETPVSNVTINTNPAAGGNDCFVDVTGIKGDVETPAYIRWPTSAITINQETLFAVRRRGTPSATPFLFQAEALTQGTDTTTQVNDANFSGAGNNYSRCTFATATMQDRLSTLDLGIASVDLRGRYRVFLRYRKNTSTDAINLELWWGDTDGDVIVFNSSYATPNTTNITTADLGDITIPAGGDPVTDPAGVELSVSDAFKFRLRAERTSGSGSIDFDFLLFVPADDRLAILKWTDPGSSYWLLDARNNFAHNRDSSDRVHSSGSPAVVGGLPMLTPNQTNRIYMLRTVQALASYTLTTVPNVSVSYLPRYLAIRPASS